jgi:predicted dehydrogenase
MIREPRRILFIGLGGAGQRHLRLFRERLPDAEMITWRRVRKTPLLNSDFSVVRGESLEERYGVTVFENLEDAYRTNPDLVVIAIPTAMHCDAIVDAAVRGIDVFVEKPAAVNLEESRRIREAIQKGGGDFFVSFQRRFHPLVERMIKAVHDSKIGPIISASVNVSSYVPDWHPYEDFHDLYACSKDLGGGVLRTECHELDLILTMFGMPKHVCSFLGNRSQHDLEVEDSAELLLDYDGHSVHASLCFMHKQQERRFIIKGQNGMIVCDLMEQTLSVACDGRDVEVDNMTLSNDELFELQLDYYLNKHKRGNLGYVRSVEALMSLIELSEK